MNSSKHKLFLIALIGLYIVLCIIGIRWGLPSRQSDRFLSPGGQPWSGALLAQDANVSKKLDSAAGADVDLRATKTSAALDQSADSANHLTQTDADIAAILLRYRLYTHQPDEMITMMALAGMNPKALKLDPRMYQYGGLFLYPIGALIFILAKLGVLTLSSDLAFFLDNPEAFANYYVVARAYSAAWGIPGILCIYAITRRLCGPQNALWAAALFTLLPIVICMSHEAKPHLPGAVLMLVAVWLAIRILQPESDQSTASANQTHLPSQPQAFAFPETPNARSTGESTKSHLRKYSWSLLCIACGAAVGMVLSTTPILILIPLIAAITAPRAPLRWLNMIAKTIRGFAWAALTYLLLNPYIGINLLTNRAVLRSNFANSAAMYEVHPGPAGFLRAVELIIEGATLPVLLLGAVGLILATIQRRRLAWPILAPALLLLLQFGLLGKDKPAEYGRFAIFLDAILPIGVAYLLSMFARVPPNMLRNLTRMILTAWLLLALLPAGAAYLINFHHDAEDGTRIAAAQKIARWIQSSEEPNPAILIDADPAPYNCPPLDFNHVDLIRARTKPAVSEQTDAPQVPSIDDAPHSNLILYVAPVDDVLHHHYTLTCPECGGAEWTHHWWLPRFATCAGCGVLRAHSPISWANKPFVMEPMRQSRERVNPEL